MLGICIATIIIIIIFTTTTKYKEDDDYAYYKTFQNAFIATYLTIIAWIILDFVIGTAIPAKYKNTEKIYYDNIIVSTNKIVYVDEDEHVNEVLINNLDSIKLQEDTETYIEVKYYERIPNWLTFSGNYKEYTIHGVLKHKGTN